MNCPKCESEDFMSTGEEGIESHYCWLCHIHWTEWQQAEISTLKARLSEAEDTLASYAEDLNWANYETESFPLETICIWREQT